MARTLGILVSSDKHLDKVIKVCRAAKKKEVEVILFFTHFGTRLIQDPRFSELEGSNMSVCKVSFESHGFEPPVQGISDKGYTTQAMHAELIDNCDRYLAF